MPVIEDDVEVVEADCGRWVEPDYRCGLPAVLVLVKDPEDGLCQGHLPAHSAWPLSTLEEVTARDWGGSW